MYSSYSSHVLTRSAPRHQCSSWLHRRVLVSGNGRPREFGLADRRYLAVAAEFWTFGKEGYEGNMDFLEREMEIGARLGERLPTVHVGLVLLVVCYQGCCTGKQSFRPSNAV